MHVKIDGVKCIMTAADAVIMKRVTLEKQLVIEYQDNIEDPYQEFLINKDILEGFETLCKKHKSKLAQKIKKDPSFALIDINSHRLESNGVKVTHEQPVVGRYPNLDGLLTRDLIPASKIGIMPVAITEVMKGFSANSAVKFSFSGSEDCIHVYQKSTEYTAIIMPTKIDR